MFPKLFSYGSFALPTYGVLVALGLVAGLAVAIRLARQGGLEQEQIYNLGIYVALAGILEDPSHKSLYMRLAKTYDNDGLLRLAKDIADRKNVTNMGAYFMKLLKSSNIPKISKA